MLIANKYNEFFRTFFKKSNKINPDFFSKKRSDNSFKSNDKGGKFFDYNNNSKKYDKFKPMPRTKRNEQKPKSKYNTYNQSPDNYKKQQKKPLSINSFLDVNRITHPLQKTTTVTVSRIKTIELRNLEYIGKIFCRAYLKKLY